jgi:flagellar biosynthesis protein
MKSKRDRAVALRYKEKVDQAPKVVAKGEGTIAQRIKELALENGIPIHRDDTLVELLAEIDIDREIPPELYSAIAEILSWIYRANNDLFKGA